MSAFVPQRLARLHRTTPVGEVVSLTRPRSYGPERWADVVHGAGFDPTGRREFTLPDYVRPRMTMLMCGLNPSPASSDACVGFARPGNRFWPAAIAARLTDRDRDPLSLLRAGVGMTDLVKRTTRRADELHPDEYRSGAARVERLVAWLRPGLVCFVGLAGWRAAVSPGARPGLQPDPFGGRAAYVMPSTSGLNARSSLGDLTEHLRAAMAIASE